MAQLGRPPKGDDKLVSVSVRLPKHVHEHYKQTGKPSSVMRKILEDYVLTYTPKRDKHS